MNHTCSRCGSIIPDNLSFCPICNTVSPNSGYDSSYSHPDYSEGVEFCVHCMSVVPLDTPICPYCQKTVNTTVPSHHIEPGSILNGKYFIGAALGEGGFGITYVGRDLSLDIKVAIKELFIKGYVNRNNTVSASVICDSTRDAETIFVNEREKYLNEARTIARYTGLDGIVGVRDFFAENNTAYIVMEYLDGITLKDKLQRGGIMSINETLTLLAPVMNALNVIHQDGLIHRDISPDNIMITNGKVKLLDFGAARKYSAVSPKGLSVILKQGYAPEEQYREKGIQGPWTDVYALCATIYECITGQKPENSTDRLVNDTLLPPSQLGVNISRETESVLMKGLAVMAQYRYQSVAELAAAFYSGSPAPSVPDPSNRNLNNNPPIPHNDTNGSQQRKNSNGKLIAFIITAAVLVVGIVISGTIAIISRPEKNAPSSVSDSDNEETDKSEDEDEEETKKNLASPVISDIFTKNGTEQAGSNVSSARKFTAAQAIDNSLDSCWCASTDKNGGVGAKIRVLFEEESEISGFRIVNGNQFMPEENIYNSNGQIKQFTLTSDNGDSESFTADFDAGTCKYQTFYFEKPFTGSRIDITIDSSYVGSKYTKNTCLTEIEFFN